MNWSRRVSRRYLVSSAAGVDGMSAKQARENLSWLLPPILKQIHEGRYTAAAGPKGVHPEGGWCKASNRDSGGD